MKNSFAILLTTMIIIVVGSVSIFILQTTTLTNNINKNKLLYIQANFHLNFLEQSILNLKIIDDINNFEINNENYNIIATFYYISKEFNRTNTNGVVKVDLEVSHKTQEIRICKRIFKKI